MDKDIFGGLEEFGLSGVAKTKTDVYAADEEAAKPAKAEQKAKEFIIDDYIYLKKFNCPVCEVTFESYVAKDSKLRRVSTDYDMRPIYAPIEPMYYDIVVCEKCGYAAFKDSFNNIATLHANRILAEITPNFKAKPYPKEPTIDDAIGRHKLALLNSVVKKGKDGERAYICMKLTWLYRIKGDVENEKAFAKLTAEGFTKALSEEHNQPAGLEENTVLYLISAFSMSLGDYPRALRILSDVIISPKSSDRLKERARDLKDEIRARQEGK